ncbi:hypothetical protein C095_04705 [Fusobacterium necrophorum subsp. funduliforme B35]|uniref:Uncharacterized protein n=1 Tax=Fusobacterium necrophorum subsp. funduliforme B35 TaxID=1226633 RepID=A0A0B4FQ51_9FUSO|nr:hypothetical protein C095_04705 [Fusobacterium necrophorum subsp. funduliforme B35]
MRERLEIEESIRGGYRKRFGKNLSRQFRILSWWKMEIKLQWECPEEKTVYFFANCFRN